MTTQIRRILICKLKFYGDLLLITPVIQSLKQRYPDAKIDLLVYQDTKAILDAAPEINAFYLIKKKLNLSGTINNFLSVRRALKKNHYDLVVNTTEQWPIALLVWSLKCRSIAFRRDDTVWNRLFTSVTPAAGRHVVEQNLSILDGLGFTEEEKVKKLSLHYRESDTAFLKALAPHFKLQRYVVIQPTARQSFKCWDDDKFANVIDFLMENNLHVFVTCGPAAEERNQVERISSLSRHKPDLTFAGKTSFLQLAALLDHAVLYIGVDSAPMHMAAALNIPQVCLFGATKHEQWRPWSDKATLIWAGDYHEMPARDDLDRSKKYLSWIPVDAVITAAENQLQLSHLSSKDF